MPSEQREIEESAARTIPKFSSFRPSTVNSQSNGTGGESVPGEQRPIPKFSSFKPPVQKLEPSIAPTASGDSDRAAHRHKRERSRSRHRDRSRDRKHHRSHGHHRSKERQREHDRSRPHEDSRRGDTYREKRKRSRSSNREKEKEKERPVDRELSKRHRTKELEHRTKELDNGDTRRRPGSVTVGEILPWDDETTSGVQLFYINTKGDPDNLIYGTIHRYSIPSYYRFGKGTIIGLPTDIRIIQDKGDGKGLVLATNSERAELHKRGANAEKRNRFALPEDRGLRRLKIVTEKDEKVGIDFDQGLEYIPLSSRKNKAIFGNGDLEDRLLFNLLESREKNPDDEDFEYTDPSDDEVDEMSNWNSVKLRQKQLEIQRKVDNDPSDIDAWLDLLAHQDLALYSGEGKKKRPTVAEKQSTAEIKLSILNKAMEKIPKNNHEARERLWESWFDVAGETWEAEKLLSKYRSTLRQYPTMHRVWVKYLNFRQTDFGSFKYTEMVGCYEQCLEVLRTAIHNKDKGDQDIPRLENIALYVIFRGLHLVQDAGYTEISIASLQALLELNIFAPLNILEQFPPSSHASHDTITDQLRDFWDAEVLRVGEEGAEGWRRYVERDSEGPVPEGREQVGDDDDSDVDFNDPFGWWVQKEVQTTERRGAWPARVLDETEEDDPFNVVLFTDIAKWMFCFSNEAVRRSLIDHMLQFCGLPRWFTRQECERNGELNVQFDSFLCAKEMANEDWFWPDSDKQQKLLTWEGMEPERKGGLTDNPFGFRLCNGYPITIDMLFGRQNGEWAFPMMEVPSSSNRYTNDINMARRVLKMILDRDLIEPQYSEKLAIFYWALEWRIDRPKAQKLAKKLLKKYRTSLLLYNAYAQIEWRMGNIDVARNVFATTLGMCGSYPEASRRDGIILWKTWAWEEIMDGNLKKALDVLLSIPNGKFIEDKSHDDNALRKTALLRAKRMLQDEQDRLASLGLFEHAFSTNEALALIEYLSSSTTTLNTASLDVSAALPTYDSLLKEMRDKGLSLSRHYEIALMNGKLRLLYHHSRSSKLFRMALLREALEEALTELKRSGRKVNTLLWSLYAWNESRSRIEGLVRGWLREQLIGPGRKDSTVAGYGFAIWAELRMTGNNVHALRNLFEEAVECPSTMASIALWKLYVEFELRSKEPTRAKLAFFRALRSCPWSKDIAILAFTRLLSVLDFDELKKVLAITVTEKELRVHDATVLEDFLGELGDERGREMYPGISASGALQIHHQRKLPDDPSSDSEGDEES